MAVLDALRWLAVALFAREIVSGKTPARRRSLPLRAAVGVGGDEPAGRSVGLRLAALVLAGGLVGCASIPPGAGTHAADPFEVYNRHMFEFNDRVDRAVLKPVAQAYETVLPQGLRTCINNAFLNVGEPINAVNNLLQGKPRAAFLDVCRFVINSTIGLFGCFDNAAKMGIERSNEDFGQTLGRWGLLPGPYFVLPLLGPSTIRDTVGRAADFLGTDPLWYIEHVPTRNVLVGTRLVDTRAGLLPAERVLDVAALDRYQFVRDAYLQMRRSLVYDGDPPPLPDPVYQDDDDVPPPPAPGAPATDQPPLPAPR
jgi:phospholipid-binding lipoprotein MlaA